MLLLFYQKAFDFLRGGLFKLGFAYLDVSYLLEGRQLAIHIKNLLFDVLGNAVDRSSAGYAAKSG